MIVRLCLKTGLQIVVNVLWIRHLPWDCRKSENCLKIVLRLFVNLGPDLQKIDQYVKSWHHRPSIKRCDSVWPFSASGPGCQPKSAESYRSNSKKNKLVYCIYLDLPFLQYRHHLNSDERKGCSVLFNFTYWPNHLYQKTGLNIMLSTTRSQNVLNDAK